MHKRAAIFGLIGIVFLLGVDLALAQTSIWTCDFSSTSCGFDLAPTNGVLNVTSSTVLNWSASKYTWSNVSFCLNQPTGGNGNKIHIANSATDWLNDAGTWKNEPTYSINQGGWTLDAWVCGNIVTNHTANTSQVCFGGSCSSAGAFAINKATDTMQIEATYAGGKALYDNMTIYVLDSEAPAAPSSNGCAYNGTGAWPITNSSCIIGNSTNALGNPVTANVSFSINATGHILNFTTFTASNGAIVTVSGGGGIGI